MILSKVYETLLSRQSYKLDENFPGHRFSWTQIFLDTDSRPDSYSDTDSTKQAFDLSNQTLNDY